MKSRYIIPIAVVVFAVFAGALAWLLGWFEPRYGGISADRHFRELFAQSSFGGKEARENVLVVPARVGVPILVRFTQAQDPRWRGWYQRIYPKLPKAIARRLGPPKSNLSLVHRSIMALGYYGPEAYPAVPELLKIEASSTSQFIQSSAITSLGEIGPGASNAIPMLIRHFQSRSLGLGAQSAMALAKIDVRGERSGLLFVSAMNDGYMQVIALDGLTKMASHDPRWISDIWRAAENSLLPDRPLNPGFVPRAAASLQSLQALDASRVNVICSQSGRNDSRVRQGVAGALFYTVDYADTTTSVLLKLAKDSNADVRMVAWSALLQYAQSTNVNLDLRVQAIRAALSGGDDNHRWRALTTVQQLGSAASPALTEIVPLLSHANERIRGKAAEALSGFGSEGVVAKRALEALLNDKWEFVRDAAGAALKAIAEPSPRNR